MLVFNTLRIFALLSCGSADLFEFMLDLSYSHLCYSHIGLICAY